MTSSFGPTITYVTDPSLSMAAQTRVLGEVIDAAERFRLRVAFRLPGSTDEEVDRLLHWYFNEDANLNRMRGLHGRLLHYRPSLADRYPGEAIWMPGRYLGSGEKAGAYSVHSRQDVELAMQYGADEVIFGHVFETDSHPNQAARGIDAMLEARQSMADEPGITFTAIGGINEGSMYLMGVAGIESVACIRAISTSPDIPRTLCTMLQGWNRGFEESIEKGLES